MAFLPCVLLSAGGPTRVGACTIRPRMALRGRSPEQRDAELQAQKEILERRRNEKKSAQYMESVASRRAEAEAFFQSNQLDIQPGEDPLEAWKRKEARGLIKPIGYEDVPEGGIPLPAASFGIPKYDNGERFDLRLPHVDVGYESADADVMGKVARFFGFGKKPDAKPKE
ncbi:hypothetical protein I4F81_009314 [Pyropia yezoensis]|uniref:Uncharacterized protein n=1 Tax=Pyropia yezoensis TaxID=2788 RepID=A0ACC3CAI8_PYRYE|nr:hypothetical protein I4F81_009314 [Neopyropia yezoensis]